MTRRWAMVVAGFFLLSHGIALVQEYVPNTWLFSDGTPYLVTTQALAEHGRLEQRDLQPQSWYLADLGWNRSLGDDTSRVALGRHGEWYPKHPILLPLLAVPFYWVFGTVGTLIVNAGLNLVFVLLLFLLSRRFIRVEAAALIACFIASSPFVLWMSYSFSNDILSADLLLGAMECVLGGWLGWAGVLVGFAVWSRVANIAFLPGFVGLAGLRKSGRAALFALIPLSLYGTLNTWMFGAPWTTSYQAVLLRDHGVLKTLSHVSHFKVPWSRAFGRIMHDRDSIVSTYPHLIPAAAGLIVLGVRRWRMAGALAAFALCPTLLFTKYEWYRPQFLYAFLGVAAIGLAALLAIVSRHLHPRETPAPSGHLRPAFAALALPLAAVPVWRHVNRAPPELLSSHVHEAKVFLGNVPCDYWNPENERWECFNVDITADATTGRMLTPHPVRGVPTSALWLGTGLRQWRRLIFDRLAARRVEMTFSLDDSSGVVPVDVVIRTQSAQVAAFQLTHAADTRALSVDVMPGQDPVLEIDSASSDPGRTHLIVEGHLN